MDTNTIFSWNGFTVFRELHWQRHLRLLWNTATCEGSTPACYSSLSHRPPIPFPTLFYLLKRRTATLPCGRARARQPRTPPSPLLPTLYSNGRPLQSGHALASSPSSLPYRRARARQPRTSPSPLLPTLYSNGRPLQSDHALLPPLFSLLSTAEAHCKVSTHFSLPSSPYSLLETCIHGIPCADSSLTASPCSSRRFLANVKSFMSLAARSTAFP